MSPHPHRDPGEARDLAALLVARWRSTAPETLAAAGVDLGPALEQQLFFALRDGPGARSPMASIRRRAMLPLALGRSLLPERRASHSDRPMLVLVRQGVHVRLLRPIIEELDHLGGPPVEIVRVGAAARDGTVRGVGHGLAAHLEPRSLRRMLRRPSVTERDLREAWAGMAEIDVDRYAAVALDALPSLVVGAAGVIGAVRGLRPRLLATFDEVGSWGRLVAAVGRAHGVLSLDLPHAEAVDPVAMRGTEFDAVAVFGPISAERVAQAGYPPERIVEIGAPHFDALVRATKETRPADPRRLVFASQYEGGVMTAGVKERTLQAAIHAAAGAAPCELVIRPHPVERDAPHATPTTRPSPDVRLRIDRETGLHELLLGAWALLTGSSQSVLEAAIAGVPAITINATGGPDPVTYAAEGLAVGATDGESAAAAVAGLLDPDRRRAQVERARASLERHLGPLDGRAARRAAELVVGLAAGEAPSVLPSAP